MPRKRKGQSLHTESAINIDVTETKRPKRPEKKNNSSHATEANLRKSPSSSSSSTAKVASSPPLSTASAADAPKDIQGKIRPDQYFPHAEKAKVFEDYDAMFNQTDIRRNRNKFFLLQVLEVDSQFYTWFRWGRVGVKGQTSISGPFDTSEPSVREFKKKYNQKSGPYTLIRREETGDSDGPGIQASPIISNKKPSASSNTAASTLPEATKKLVELIFDSDMFTAALRKFDLDLSRMPLGKLSSKQIDRGYFALDSIGRTLQRQFEMNEIMEATSNFYSIIPHYFGKHVPPPILTEGELTKKYEMLAMLRDIQKVNSVENGQCNQCVIQDSTKDQASPSPVDTKYKQLQCDLQLIDKAEFKILETYYEMTQTDGWQLNNIWRVNREGEAEVFSQSNHIDNRKLLWHGTNMVAVAAILKCGLRITPRSEGAAGKGLYFASEHSRACFYSSRNQKQALLFLCEVALGKTHQLKCFTKPDWTEAPKGCDSVWTYGRQEPDPAADTTIKLDGKSVSVPQGRPIQMPGCGSAKHKYDQSEYVVYNEKQCRIRYLVLFDLE